MLLSDFQATFPEFSTDLVEKYFPSVEAKYQCYSEEEYDTASQCDKIIILYLVAHLLSLRIKQGEAYSSGTGAQPERLVAKRQVDSISENFVITSYDIDGDKAFWTSTPYGQEFLELNKFKKGAA